MTHYDYYKFTHPVPEGYTIPKDTQVRSTESTTHVETFFTTKDDYPITTWNTWEYYLGYDITKPKTPEEINSVIYNARVGKNVFPVAVYQGSHIWSAFSDLGERTSIYAPEIDSFDTTPPKEGAES